MIETQNTLKKSRYSQNHQI